VIELPKSTTRGRTSPRDPPARESNLKNKGDTCGASRADGRVVAGAAGQDPRLIMDCAATLI